MLVLEELLHTTLLMIDHICEPGLELGHLIGVVSQDDVRRGHVQTVGIDPIHSGAWQAEPAAAGACARHDKDTQSGPHT